jgi:hypothetical protein
VSKSSSSRLHSVFVSVGGLKPATVVVARVLTVGTLVHIGAGVLAVDLEGVVDMAVGVDRFSGINSGKGGGREEGADEAKGDCVGLHGDWKVMVSEEIVGL